MKRVVITGMGIVVPDATDCRSLWNNLLQNHSSIRKITKCDVSKLKIKYGGQVMDCGAAKIIPKRFLKKCDDFSVYALVAVDQALQEAALEPAGWDAARTGIYVGNNSGGWNSAEQGLKALHYEGAESVSPFLASNWFPAAPQGHISLLHGITGYSKTLSADMASSNIAIGNAYHLIKNGVMDCMLAGGTENLMTAWGLLVYQTNPLVSCRQEGAEGNIYQPFGSERSGLVLSEGAAFLVLESLESALARRAAVHGEITGFAASCDSCHSWKGDSRGEQYARVIRAIREDGFIPDYISLNGAAEANEDNSEINGIKLAFHDCLDKIDCSCPKGFFGHSFGAAGALDVIIAILSMQHSRIIRTGNVVKPASNVDFNLVTGSHLDKTVNRCLVLNRGMGGINSGLALKKWIPGISG